MEIITETKKESEAMIATRNVYTLAKKRFGSFKHNEGNCLSYVLAMAEKINAEIKTETDECLLSIGLILIDPPNAQGTITLENIPDWLIHEELTVAHAFVSMIDKTGKTIYCDNTLFTEKVDNIWNAYSQFYRGNPTLVLIDFNPEEIPKWDNVMRANTDYSMDINHYRALLK